MERCPNCGSTVRSGAKFCTTCGFRLPEAATDAAASSSRSPFDTTSNVSGGWTVPSSEAAAQPMPPPATEPAIDDVEISAVPAAAPEAPPPAQPEPSPTSTEQAQQPEAEEPAGGFAGWPSFATGYATSGASDPTAPAVIAETAADAAPVAVEPVDGVAPAAEEPAADAAADEPLTDAAQSPMEEPASIWSPTAETGEDTSAPTQPETAIDAADAEADGQPAAPVPAEGAAWALPAPMEDPPVAAETEPETGVAAPAAEQEQGSFADAADTTFPESADEATAVPEAEQIDATATAQPAEAPNERAQRLLDELRDLIPTLGVASAPGVADHAAVADALAASRATAEAETETFRSLRAAVATAQARPRDVDVMLDLVNRADTIAAVMSAHDRYAAAIEAATRALRGEEEPAAPRW